MESTIKWQTGIVVKRGWYLVTTIHGKVVPAYWTGTKWSNRLKDIIIAWCKVSDVEPYKE